MHLKHPKEKQPEEGKDGKKKTGWGLLRGFRPLYFRMLVSYLLVIPSLFLIAVMAVHAGSDEPAQHDCNTGSEKVHSAEPDPLVIRDHGFGELVDDRDGTVYKTIKIGDQVWMAENLNYETGSSWCYDDAPENCQIYGRLYNWHTAMEACPPGWYLPGDEEWSNLVVYLDPSSNPNAVGYQSTLAGHTMKSVGTEDMPDGRGLWRSPNTGATNSSGFTGLPGGYRSLLGTFYNVNCNAYWWSATQRMGFLVWNRELKYNTGNVYRYSLLKQYGLSVRCIKKNPATR